MKILKLEMENLNSLKGKWVIDFTHKSYLENGNQFVICGDTGSGKTTILDAIMLGLYGKTPREETITKEENEVLRRGTARCLAAVTYECNGYTYRSEFFQNRAREQVHGKLQQPKVSVKNMTTGELYDAKSAKNLADKTTEIVGLNYDQFCKSVLLAQGSFSKFLNGDEREKAEILAKLNGTEEYKKAAAWLWEEARNKIQENTAEINGINGIKVLAAEEVAAYEKQIQHYKSELEKQKKEQDALEKMLLWKQDVMEKEQALSAAKNKKEETQKALMAFSAEKEVLEKAQKAVACETSFVLYEHLQKKKENLRETIKHTEERLVTAEKNKNAAEETQKEYRRLYEDLSGKQPENGVLWKRVRALDGEIEKWKEDEKAQKKRYTAAKKEYEDGQRDSKELKTKIEADRIALEEASAYIRDHKAEEDLDVILSGLKEKNISLQGLLGKYEEVKSNKKEKASALQAAKKELENLQADLQHREERLQDFISANYKSIANVLRRNSLKEGKPCPVCGSHTHPICENFCTTEENTEPTADNSVAAIAGEYSNAIERKQSEKTAAEKKIAVLEAEIKSIQAALVATEEDLEGIIATINHTISVWQLKLEEDIFSPSMTEAIQNIFATLEERSNQYKAANKKLEEAANRKEINETALNAIKLEELKAKQQIEETRALELGKQLEDKKQERVLLFGENNVDVEEEKFNTALQALWKTYQEAIESGDGFQKEFHQLDTQRKEYFKNQITSEKELKNTTEKLNREMAANDFGSIEELKRARLEKEQVSALQKKRDTLNNAQIEAETMLKDAEKKYREVVSKQCTNATIEELEGKRLASKNESTRISESIGEINKILTDNEKARKEKAGLEKRKQELEQQNILYMDLQSIIGRKSGDEIEVFVQTLALNNLLIRANEHLKVIMPEYVLVQRPGHVDCLVRDVNRPEPENDRPISNFSGGEIFGFSLALALGIAEVASNKVQIESLFLDEGFGTLSGEPLERSINALRRLGKTGKMLGIITHVERVIEAFPQKITAKKVNGISTLQGAGISQEGN